MRGAAIVRFLAVSALTAAVVTPAAADDGYRTPMIATDVTTDVLLTVGFVLEQDKLIGVGVLGYALGGPIIHLAQGHEGRAAGSLGIRVVTPLLLGFLGCLGSASDGHHGGEPAVLDVPDGCGIGAALGVVVAQALDAGFLAHGDDPKPAMLSFGGRF